MPTYQFGFDIRDHVGFALVITRATFTYTVNLASFSASLFYPGLGDSVDYNKFHTTLEAAIAAAAAAAGDPTSASWGVTWSHANSTYAISHGTTVWTATLDIQAQRVLGMAASLGSAQVHTSTVRPYYVIRTSSDSFKSEGPDYEPTEAAPDEEETDDGDAASLSRTTLPVYHDLMQLWEPRAACEPLSATAAVPWTWRDAFKHARAEHAFVLIIAPHAQSSVSWTAADVWAKLKLRANGAVWRSVRSIARPSPLDTFRHIPLKCRVLIRLSD